LRKEATNQDIIKLMNEQHKEKMAKLKEINMHSRRILEISKRIEKINERFLPVPDPADELLKERFKQMFYTREKENEKGN
jgi:hypothetical protein